MVDDYLVAFQDLDGTVNAFAHDFPQQVKWDGHPIKLAAALVGQQDSIHSQIG